MNLNEMGRIFVNVWKKLPERFEVCLECMQVMPNHVHGIIRILNENVGAIHELPLQGAMSRRKMQLPKIIGYLKMNSAKQINLLRGTSGMPVFQRNYYEHVIRDESDYSRARQYVENNPADWAGDKENPVNIFVDNEHNEKRTV